MRQPSNAFAVAMIVAASCLASISQAALKPIDIFVDWLEGVYAGEGQSVPLSNNPAVGS
jgi:hypothetical protein